jgi:hypothetical protein
MSARESASQVFGAGEDIDIRFLGVPILWQPLVRLPTNARKGKAPAEAEEIISGA